MKLRVFDTITTPPPKKKFSESQKNYNFADFFFLTLSNKRNKMSGDHDWRRQGGESRRLPGGAWENEYNNSMWVGVPLWGYISM